MKIFHSPKHELRYATIEFSDGALVAPFEKPERMNFILDELAGRGYPKPITPPDSGLTTTAKIHRSDYLEFLQNAYPEWEKSGKTGDAMTFIWPAATMRQDVIPAQIEAKIGYYCLSTDTGLTKGTWEAALSSKDCAEAAADHIQNGRDCAFSLARPPGHHASTWQFGGYCFLNNAAIAAQRLLDHGAERISILDVDFHHGNGTQEIFYTRKDVQFLSLHGDPDQCFPHFLGYANEKGKGAGEGFNHNYPLPEGTEYSEWKGALLDAMSQIKTYSPDALIISLGVDTFEKDPISAFKLKSEEFLYYGALLRQLRLPTIFIMEGGYAIDEIGINTANVLDGFQGA